MNAREEPTKKLKIGTETSASTPVPTTRSINSFFSEEKLQEMALFQKLRTLKKSLEGQNFKLLLAARLTSIDSVLMIPSTNRGVATPQITRPGTRYLKSIIHNLSDIILQNRDALNHYLTESLKSNTTQNIHHVILVADILSHLKRNIMETGLLSEQAGVFENTNYVKMLKQNFNWIAYFQYVIKSAFTKMGVQEDSHCALLKLTSSLFVLQDLTYRSIQKNFPEVSVTYQELEVKPNTYTQAGSYFFPNVTTPTSGDSSTRPSVAMEMKR